jgi:hypothetical protein
VVGVIAASGRDRDGSLLLQGGTHGLPAGSGRDAGSGWEELASHEVARRLFELVAALAALHQAVTYGWLLDSLDPSERWQFGSALEDWVTRALADPVLSG